MKKFQIILLLVSINSFTQNRSSIEFDDLKLQLNQNNIQFDSLGVDSNYKLNSHEQKTIQCLNDKIIDFKNEKIAFVTGSAGTTIVDKTIFFKNFKSWYDRNALISFTLVKLDKKNKEISGFDYIMVFWAKMYNPNSKKLLKKLKKISHNY